MTATDVGEMIEILRRFNPGYRLETRDGRQLSIDVIAADADRQVITLRVIADERRPLVRLDDSEMYIFENRTDGRLLAQWPGDADQAQGRDAMRQLSAEINRAAQLVPPAEL